MLAKPGPRYFTMELGGEDVVAPAVVAGLGNAEELGEAWHLVAGYPSSHMSEAGMTALLDQHQDFGPYVALTPIR